MRVLLNPSSGHKQSSADSIAKARSGAHRYAPSFSANFNGPVAQAAMIDIDPHGQIWVPDDVNLVPDQPVFGGTSNVGSGVLAHPAATSMEALVTPAHPQGSEPKALGNLFDGLPTKGNYKLNVNSGKQKDGSTLYIKGHLLNDNLGGPGTAENLFPITHQANVDHDLKVEEPIKDHVNKEGGAIHYAVSVSNIKEGDTALYDTENKSNLLKYVDADFTCRIKEYKSDKTQRVRPSITIKSRWGATDNKEVDGLALFDKNTHGVADAFDATKVKLMPRAIAKKEWDIAYTQLVHALADIDGVDFSKWLKGKVKGLGAESIKLLAGNVDYEVLPKEKKGLLTKARNLLKDFLEENYQNYLTVTAGYDEGVVDTSVEEELDIEALFKEAYEASQRLREVDLEIDMLTLEFSKLSISEEPKLDNSLIYKRVMIINNPEEPKSKYYKGYYAEVREHAGLGRFVLMIEANNQRIVLTRESFRLLQ